MSTTPKVLLITEKHNVTVKADSNGEYVLEGVFAEFGVKNNNNRIYEEAEYLPHLKYLKEQITKNNLVGELDHPEKFEVSLSKVSHIIEDLSFDKDSRQIRGKIRILDTDAGRNAKKLIDGGVQLSISSRAAGIVESNNRVKLRRIFTYDLVANPGFANAQLNRVNEAMDFSSENTDLYDFTTNCSPALLESLLSGEGYIAKDSSDNMNEQYLKTEDFDKYSSHVSENFSGITKEISELKESLKAGGITEEKFDKLVKFVEHIAEETEKREAEAVKLQEQLENSINFSNYLAEKLKTSILYTEYSVTEGYQKLEEYAAYLGKELKESILFTEQVAESADAAEKNMRKYANYLSEQVTKAILFGDAVAEELKESQTKIQGLEEYNQLLSEGKITLKGGEQSATRVERQVKLNESIQSLLLTIENQKNAVTEANKYPFATVLSDEKKGVFESLEETKKQKVAQKLSAVSAELISEGLVLETIDAVVNESSQPLWISLMPENVSKVWESLDEKTKQAYERQAVYYNLTTPAQVKNFWETRNLQPIKMIEESQKEQTPSVDTGLGYSKDYIEAIRKSKI